MADELTGEDWQAIAQFYQKKYNELEMQVLALEIQQRKAATETAQAVADAAAEEE